MLKIFDDYRYQVSDLENRINRFSIPVQDEAFYKNSLLKLLGVLDLTTLEGSDTEAKVIALCRKAAFSKLTGNYPDSAAVCVYPSLVKVAVRELKGTGIHVASVAGAFPSGQSGLHIKLEEVKYAIGEGADEIDTVISRGKLIEGADNEVYDELCAIREMCGNTHLKVILETGELPTVALIRKASELAILSGADFIKTSTGKISVGATPVAFLVMLDTIHEYLEKTGKSIGIKPAGGIRTPEQALVYVQLLTKMLGEQWFQKNYFRIGASSLADDILKVLA